MKNAQYYYWAIVLAFGFGLYTYKYHLHSPASVKVVNDYFKTPKIGQNLLRQPLKLYEKDHLWPTSTHLMGKFPFSDSIYLTENSIPFSDEDYYFPNWDSENSTEEVYPLDGLQLKIDHTTYIKGRYSDENKAHIPVFIVNETGSTKYLFGTNEYVVSMIEAKDRTGVWRPIEYVSRPTSCTSTIGFIKIHPKEFCLLALPLFRGDFKTQIRVKLKNQHSILISEAFPGYINEDQFKFKPDSWLKRALNESTQNQFPFWFLGSIPLEFNQ